MKALVHGGPDALGVPRWDFSSNANSAGPAPHALARLAQADRRRYPDPAYTALRERLAQWHGVRPSQVLVAASASEFIRRMSLAVALRLPGAAVRCPQPGYGDYAAAANALGLRVVGPEGEAPLLAWVTQPGSPHGQVLPSPQPGPTITVLDLAYQPLQLSGAPAELPLWAWQLWSPNKALGLTGVRGAYSIAPAHAGPWLQALEALAPSWPLGAEGVALLEAWASVDTEDWLVHARAQLRQWKAQQLALCAALGWLCVPSDTPYHLVRWPGPRAVRLNRLRALRDAGIKLRDTASMGLPDHVRMSVQPPEAQQALRLAWSASMRPAPAMKEA